MAAGRSVHDADDTIERFPQLARSRAGQLGGAPDVFKVEWAATMSGGGADAEDSVTVANLEAGYAYRLYGLKFDTVLNADSTITLLSLDPAATIMNQWIDTSDTNTLTFYDPVARQPAEDGAWTTLSQGALLLASSNTGSLTVVTSDSLSAGKISFYIERFTLPNDTPTLTTYATATLITA